MKKRQNRLVRNRDANIIQLVGIEPTQKARFIDKIITESVLYWQFQNETYFWSFTAECVDYEEVSSVPL